MFQLLSAMVAKLGNMDDPLPQESFEGVDEDEWVSACEDESWTLWCLCWGKKSGSWDSLNVPENAVFFMCLSKLPF